MSFKWEDLDTPRKAIRPGPTLENELLRTVLSRDESRAEPMSLCLQGHRQNKCTEQSESYHTVLVGSASTEFLNGDGAASPLEYSNNQPAAV